MFNQLVAEGQYADLINLGQFENQIAEGQTQQLEITMRYFPDGVTQQIEQMMLARGVEGAKVSASGNKVFISFKKGFPWLAAIAVIILSIIILAIVILAWKLFKEVLPASIAKPVMTALIIGVVAIVGVVAFKSVKGAANQRINTAKRLL